MPATQELREHTPEERAAIDARLQAQHDATKVERHMGENGCPSYTQITLPNGRIICVFDESVEDDTKAHVQVFENIDQLQECETPTLSIGI